MRLQNSNNCRLVTLQPGKYWRVDPHQLSPLQLIEPTNALLVEFQGRHGRFNGLSTSDECWHALVGGDLVLVWETDFHKRRLPDVR